MSAAPVDQQVLADQPVVPVVPARFQLLAHPVLMVRKQLSWDFSVPSVAAAAALPSWRWVVSKVLVEMVAVAVAPMEPQSLVKLASLVPAVAVAVASPTGPPAVRVAQAL